LKKEGSVTGTCPHREALGKRDLPGKMGLSPGKSAQRGKKSPLIRLQKRKHKKKVNNTTGRGGVGGVGGLWVWRGFFFGSLFEKQGESAADVVILGSETTKIDVDKGETYYSQKKGDYIAGKNCEKELSWKNQKRERRNTPYGWQLKKKKKEKKNKKKQTKKKKKKKTQTKEKGGEEKKKRIRKKSRPSFLIPTPVISASYTGMPKYAPLQGESRKRKPTILIN